MRSRQTALSPWLRSIAGFTLVVFVVAQSMCFLHCNFGGGHGNGGVQPSCHGLAHSKSHPDSQGAPNPAPTASCSTLKTMLARCDPLTQVDPPLHTLYLLAPAALPLNAAVVAPRAPISRQTWRRDWVFTPLVCLGPAFRSLAPPFLS